MCYSGEISDFVLESNVISRKGRMSRLLSTIFGVKARCLGILTKHLLLLWLWALFVVSTSLIQASEWSNGVEMQEVTLGCWNILLLILHCDELTSSISLGLKIGAEFVEFILTEALAAQHDSVWEIADPTSKRKVKSSPPSYLIR